MDQGTRRLLRNVEVDCFLFAAATTLIVDTRERFKDVWEKKGERERGRVKC